MASRLTTKFEIRYKNRDQIVLAHEGNVEVTSNDEEGTTFTIHLPRQLPPQLSSPAAV